MDNKVLLTFAYLFGMINGFYFVDGWISVFVYTLVFAFVISIEEIYNWIRKKLEEIDNG